MSIDYDYKQQDWKILLLRKSYAPDHRLFWQNGLLNSFGGKIESNELPDECIKRETYEELGLKINNFKLFCITEKVSGNNDGDEVYFYKAYIDELPKNIRNETDKGEKIELINFNEISSRKDLVDNLHWLIPMAYKDNGNLLAEVIYK